MPAEELGKARLEDRVVTVLAQGMPGNPSFVNSFAR